MTPKEYAGHFWNMRVCLKSPKATEYPEVVAHPAATLYFAEKSVSGMLNGVSDAIDSVLSEEHGIWYPVRVASYRLGSSGEDANGDGKVNAEKVDGKKDIFYKDKLNHAMGGKSNISVRVRRIDGAYESKTFDNYKQVSYAAVAPFSGKGFPEEVQVSLQLRFRYQKTVLSLEKFCAASFIGLDCNGFVGGYLRRRNSQTEWHRTTAGWGPSTQIGDLMGPPANFFTSKDQFVPGGSMLMLGMCNAAGTVLDNDGKGGHGHIMISEPNTLRKQGDDISFEVVESTGGSGLVASEYKVVGMPKTGVFKVSRGAKKGTGSEFMLVRVRLVT